MLLYLVRHAAAAARDASKWPDDADRPLTRKGKRRFARAARGLKRAGAKADVVLSSRYVRAWATAEILAKRARWAAPVPCEELEGGVPPADVLAVLRALDPNGTAAVALVGHEPHLSELLSYLLSGETDRVDTTLKKGAVVCLDAGEQPEAGRATLLWVAQPKLLRAIR